MLILVPGVIVAFIKEELIVWKLLLVRQLLGSFFTYASSDKNWKNIFHKQQLSFPDNSWRFDQ